jgi:hypothetical protein
MAGLLRMDSLWMRSGPPNEYHDVELDKSGNRDEKGVSE